MKRTKFPEKKLGSRTREVNKLTVGRTLQTEEFDPNKRYTIEELESIMTFRQIDFCRELINNGYNRVKAYQKIYKNNNYQSSGALSCQLLKTPKIAAYVALIREDFENLVYISKARQLQEYMKIAYSNINQYHNSWIELKDYEKLKAEDPECMAAIQSIETKVEKKIGPDKKLINVEYVKITCHSKIAALQAIDALLGYKSAEKVNMIVEQPLFPETT